MRERCHCEQRPYGNMKTKSFWPELSLTHLIWTSDKSYHIGNPLLPLKSRQEGRGQPSSVKHQTPQAGTRTTLVRLKKDVLLMCLCQTWSPETIYWSLQTMAQICLIWAIVINQTSHEIIDKMGFQKNLMSVKEENEMMKKRITN